MRSLEFLDPEITAKLLEGQEDVLSTAARSDDRFYAAQTCPRCGGNCRKLGDYHTMYTGADALPKFYLQCLACGEEFDPHSGLILKMGNVARAFTPAYPILDPTDD